MEKLCKLFVGLVVFNDFYFRNSALHRATRAGFELDKLDFVQIYESELAGYSYIFSYTFVILSVFHLFLKKNDIQANPTDKLKEVAKRAEITTMEIMEMIK